MPSRPFIYHITHVNNLPNIIKDGRLWSDSDMIAQRKTQTSIGLGAIKERRLRLPVQCYPHTCVGQYVPFNFCPRSIMLYLLHRGNHPDLSYREGQDPIIHLEADLYQTAQWADRHNSLWAFSLSNAGALYTEFRNRLDQLDEINWAAVNATDFRDDLIKEGKQAEFLVHRFFPWYLVRRIGVISISTRRQVMQALTQSSHQPVVQVCRDWYY